MSTIPSTHDRKTPYTLVGQRDSDADPNAPGVIILNRSSRLVRRDFIADIVRSGYSEIISVESRENAFSVESLNREFPAVRFLLLEHPLNTGTRINLAMRLMNAENVLVMWSTMEPPAALGRTVEQLKNGVAICLAPALRNDRGESLPVVQVPALHRRQLRVLTLPIRGRTVDTLFPYDYVGIYNRRRFERNGMYDEKIMRPFWQKLDFGFRLNMWGETIRAEPTFRMSYRSIPSPEDQTAADGYNRFYAKNLAVRLREDGARVRPLQAIPFALRSQCSITESLSVFREAAQWIEEHRNRFIHDAKHVVQNWSVENE